MRDVEKSDAPTFNFSVFGQRVRNNSIQWRMCPSVRPSASRYVGGEGKHNLTACSITRVIKSRRMRWAGHVARMEEVRGVYRVLVGSSEGKRPLGRPRRSWEDNIKMGFREIGFDGANWIQLARERVQWRAFVNTVMNLRVP
jgi:hypothetical protein